MNESKIIIKNVRFSYVHVFEKDNNGKYSVSLIIPKSSPQIDEIKGAIKAAMEAGKGKLGDKFTLSQALSILHDGDLEKSGDEAYANAYYLNARSNRCPGVVKPNTTGLGGKVINATPEEFYSGCFGHASINFFAYNTTTKKGVGCSLNNLLKTDEGEPLGGQASAESDFGECAECNEELAE